MRFSKAKMLAELPTTAITDRDLDLVDVIVRRLQVDDPPAAMLIGDPYMGKQMALRLSPAQLEVPATTQQAELFGVRAVPGQLEALADPVNAPRQLMGVDFGWANEGNPYGQIIYGKAKTPEGQAWVAQQRFAGRLRAALPELMAQVGMRPGDVLYNTPVGTKNGDYARAKTYMKSGFGVPTTENEQFARIAANGDLVPIQPFGADQGLVRNLGWQQQPAVSMSNSPLTLQ